MRLKKILAILFSALVLSCTETQLREDKGTTELNDERIRMEIQSMMEKSGPHNFLIFEEIESGKFVQFAENENKELLFDLPTAQMTKKEFEVADSILSTYGIRHSVTPMYTDETESVVTGSLAAFSKEIGNDIDLAVELTIKVMTKIYGFAPDAKLKIQTD